MPRRIPFLGPGDELPPSSEALEFPNGLLAAGGELTPGRLLAAYRRGIFPWYEEPQPVLWWTPDPRSVLFPGELHISRSLRKVLRRDGFALAEGGLFRASLLPRCFTHWRWRRLGLGLDDWL